MSECKSCSAEILWCTTDKNHKNMPLDPEPADDGVWVKVRLEGEARIIHRLTTAELEAARDNKARYHSHWESCPSAAEHRKAKS
jgi:hypothetical protein